MPLIILSMTVALCYDFSLALTIIIIQYSAILAYLSYTSVFKIKMNNLNYKIIQIFYYYLRQSQLTIMGILIIINHMSKKILGKLNLNYILWVMIPAMIVTPLYCYHMAVSKGQQPPFPHATVTDNATHYPQDIVFRYVMLFNSSFLALLFYVAFRWMQSQAQRVHFHKPPKYQFYLAEGSIVCYGITIGTIDGQGIGKLHGPCAVIFFIIWLITVINMTIYMTKMREWDTSTIGRCSLHIKQILAIYIALLWGWCIYQITQEGSGLKKQDIYVVIVEWNSVLINLFWVLTLVFEWRHFKLCLASKK